MGLDMDIRFELLRDHDRNPRNYEIMAAPSSQGYRYNPRCGDKYTVYLRCEGEKLTQVRYMGWGCAVSKASGSMLCEAMEGLALDEARIVMQEFRNLIAGQPSKLDPDAHFDLFSMEGMHQNPLRQTCALLAWDAFAEALAALDGSFALDRGPAPEHGA